MLGEKVSLNSFLVLGFAIFIVGFLTGIVAVVLMPANSGATTSDFIIFVFGFITGMVTVALTVVIVKLTELSRKSSTN